MSASGDDIFCSDVEVEPLPGTAKQGDVYVLFEWPGPWSHDVLDGGTLGEELSAEIKAHLKKFGASLQLIRHPTREGRRIDDHHLYIVHTRIGLTEVKHVEGPEAILQLDLSGPGKNHAMARPTPLVLVCTHGKRDRCCAVKGRPLVSELEKIYPFNRGSDVVWETSHIKGHRFAATLLLMPWGYSFGRMNLEATEAMIADAMRGQYFVPGNRGRGTFSPVAQAAEVGVAAHLAAEGTRISYGQLEVVGEDVSGEKALVTLIDASTSATFEATMRRSAVSGVLSSCGEEPKEGAVWGVDKLERTSGA
ncbi:sucrase ferredoxin [Corynebacterium qintianiae]|uniref:Sucrase ferredoxin n=1 Tax=Corynebacterium qintianiae TaxID=2709392 RepID=A0A7T0PEU4_9CORY|nr:sucrase ferredoxin [Corynebacterium qintianiae]QPK83611.1 sucrase ferredoxin [Corynebacterium qintianiae]